ncbi:MAG: hypothetical protein MUF58_17650 [Arcicella sp.]|jgi:hypothetical protein|nr:hypothetical protein [Arcicella sp.]
MQTVLFSPDADNLKFDIRFTGLIGASYRATLFEKNSNTIVTEFTGNNNDPTNDTFPLPVPLNSNDERVIELWVLYSALDDADIGSNFSVEVNILQTVGGVDTTLLTFGTNGKILANNPAFHEFILFKINP